MTMLRPSKDAHPNRTVIGLAVVLLRHLKALFGVVDFKDGLNVVLAEIRLPENRKKTLKTSAGPRSGD